MNVQVAVGSGLVLVTVVVILLVVRQEGQARWDTPRWLAWAMHTVLTAWVAFGLWPLALMGGA